MSKCLVSESFLKSMGLKPKYAVQTEGEQILFQYIGTERSTYVTIHNEPKKKAR